METVSILFARPQVNKAKICFYLCQNITFLIRRNSLGIHQSVSESGILLKLSIYVWQIPCQR